MRILIFLALNFIIPIFRVSMSFRGKPMGRLLLLGIVQPVIYYICENYGIAMTSTSFSGLMLALRNTLDTSAVDLRKIRRIIDDKGDGCGSESV